MNENKNIDQEHRSILSLKHVFIDEIIFERKENNNFNENLNFKLGCSIEANEEQNIYIIKLTTELGNKDNKDDSYLKLCVAGEFNIQINSKITDDIKEFLIKKNTISILFPYIRSYITTITSQTGMKPIILPTINVNTVLQNSDKEK